MLKFFRIPFANSGDKAAIPDAADVNGYVSYTEGWPFDYQRQKTDSAAKNIERDKMNELFFDVTKAISELQSQGAPDFITSALNGGAPYSYNKGALVTYNKVVYQSQVDSNTSDPTNATKWSPLLSPAQIQGNVFSSAYVTGTANALAAAFSPTITALPAAPGTLSVLVRAGLANTGAATFAADGLTAKIIVKGNNLPLVAGDIAGAGHWLHLDYDATLDKWVLLNPFNPLKTINGESLLGSGNLEIGSRLVFSASLPLTGTSVSIPDIPSWATRVGFHFANAGTSAAAQPPMIRLGNGGIVTTGYLGSVGMVSSGGGFAEYTSTGVPVQLANSGYWPATARATGSIYFVKRLGTNEWIWEGGVSNEASGSYVFASSTCGRVSLGGALTQAQVTTPGGTATFTAGGTVFLTFEG